MAWQNYFDQEQHLLTLHWSRQHSFSSRPQQDWLFLRSCVLFYVFFYIFSFYDCRLQQDLLSLRSFVFQSIVIAFVHCFQFICWVRTCLVLLHSWWPWYWARHNFKVANFFLYFPQKLPITVQENNCVCFEDNCIWYNTK